MRKNMIPAVMAFAPAVLLPLIQNVVRPGIAHTSRLAFMLSWAPDFVVGFCFPFSILIKPRAWTSSVATKLFIVWSALTILALLLVEYLSPFGPNVFDRLDIVAGVGGVALAGLFFYTFMRRWLTFADAAGPVALKLSHN
jgi:hypothetical protein